MRKILIHDTSHVYGRYLYNYLSDLCEVSVITKSKQANQFHGASFDFFYFILHEPDEILTLLALQNTINIKSKIICSATTLELSQKLKELDSFFFVDLAKPKQELLFAIKLIIKSNA